MMLGVKQWLGLIFTLLGFILFLVGYSTQYWYYEVDPEFGDEFYYGIWRTYSIVADTIACVDWMDLTNNEDWFTAVQAMESIGLILLFVGVILLVVYIFCKEDNKYIKYFAISFLFAAALFILTGVIIFGVEAEQSIINNLGFSFYFVVVSVALILIGDFFVCFF